MQIVIQGLFFCSAQHRQRNELLWAVCLIDDFYTNSIHCSLVCNTAPKTSKLSQMATNFVSFFCFFFRNLLLIHKKLKKDERDFRFSCNLFALATCTLDFLLALIYTITSLGWLLLFFVGWFNSTYANAAREGCVHRCRRCHFKYFFVFVKYSKTLHGVPPPGVKHLRESLEMLAFHFPTWSGG